jgi:hypothetical protein
METWIYFVMVLGTWLVTLLFVIQLIECGLLRGVTSLLSRTSKTPVCTSCEWGFSNASDLHGTQGRCPDCLVISLSSDPMLSWLIFFERVRRSRLIHICGIYLSYREDKVHDWCLVKYSIKGGVLRLTKNKSQNPDNFDFFEPSTF